MSPEPRSERAHGIPLHCGWPLAALALVACATRLAPVGNDEPRTGSLTLLHTNDMHCHFEPSQAPWLEGAPAIGGMVALDAYVRTVRQEVGERNLLLLDAGDVLTGTPISELPAAALPGQPRGGEMLLFMRDIGYDAWALGNHEFDQGFDNAAALVAASPLPVLSANLRAAPGEAGLAELQQARIFDSGGLQVGVIGILTEDLQALVGVEDWARLRLSPAADSVAQQLEALDPQTDLLVVLSHAGLEDDKALAAAVPGIDLIVGGHSHDALRQPLRAGDTWIVQAGSQARSVGRLDIQVRADAIAGIQGSLENLLPGPEWSSASQAVVERTEALQAQVEERFGRVVGLAPQALGRDSHQQSALGRWICEVLRRAAQADVALFNNGGIRADIPAGPVDLGQLYQAFPFGNEVVVTALLGEDLERIVRRNIVAERTGRVGALQTAGLSWPADQASGDPAAPQVLVGGKALESQKLYVVATNAYLAEHFEERFQFPLRSVLTGLGSTVLELAVQAAEAEPMTVP